METIAPSAVRPRFSVIVPTHRRPEQLAQCLDALGRLDYPRDGYEVVIVDDGSGAPLADVIARARGHVDVTLIVSPENRGPARARNLGAAAARGELLAFTDDDCAPAADWLRVLDACLAVDPDALIGGRTVNGLADNHYAAASQLLIDYLYEYYHDRANGGDGPRARFFTSNNLALSATGFREAGAFDETFPLAAAEDREFCDRWLHQGRRMRYAPEAIIRHYHHSSLRMFWRQHAHYGRGALSYHILRARRTEGRVTLEPLTFYLELVRYPLSRSLEPAWVRRRLAALLAISQGAYAVGFLAAHLERTVGRLDGTRR